MISFQDPSNFSYGMEETPEINKLRKGSMPEKIKPQDELIEKFSNMNFLELENANKFQELSKR